MYLPNRLMKLLKFNEKIYKPCCIMQYLMLLFKILQHLNRCSKEFGGKIRVVIFGAKASSAFRKSSPGFSLSDWPHKIKFPLLTSFAGNYLI